MPYRWSRVIQRHPVVAALAGVVILLVLAIPFFSLRLAFSDEGNYPEETTTRQAYDLLALGFGPGFNGPMLLAAEIPEGTDPAALEGVTEALAADPGVAFVTPAVPTIRQAADRGAVAAVPDDRSAGRGDHRPRRSGSATRCCPRRQRAPGSTSRCRAGWPRRSTSRST